MGHGARSAFLGIHQHFPVSVERFTRLFQPSCQGARCHTGRCKDFTIAVFKGTTYYISSREFVKVRSSACISSQRQFIPETCGVKMRQGFRAGRLALRVGVSRGGWGFSLVELLIGMTILAVGLLGIATMFSTGYTDIAAGGKTTAAIEAARQIMEDIRLLPTQAAFTNVYNLNNVDTSDGHEASLPAAGTPERLIAQKFRFLMAGTASQATWGIASPSLNLWGASANASNTAFTGQGTITVADVGAIAQTLAQVTVTVTITGRPAVVMTSLISRL
jgi:type II secretory pathway pseudopilin PulG